MLALGISAAAVGQTLVVTSGGNTVNQGNTLTITTVPSMPDLVLSVNGGTSCDSFSYQIDVEYTDQAGYTTGASYGALNVEGDLSSTVPWLGVLEGGNATITWTFDGVQQSSSFGFFINGSNPTNSTVDANIVIDGGPWFSQNLIAWESGAYKYAPYSQYHQFVAAPYDPVWGTPDGIGLMQLEPVNRASGDQDYWNWGVNLADGFHYLSSILARNGNGTGPYGVWTVEYNDMVANTAATGFNPVAANWPSDCQNHVNHAICGGYGTTLPAYCSFNSSNSNGSPNGFGDANWIHAYNGSYFVVWDDGVNGAVGNWEYDDQGPQNGYVYNVCSARPL
jgi:hypothetical protein